MTELASVKKGEGEMSLRFDDGKLIASIAYDGAQADVKLEISLGVEEYLELLKKAIPGTIDDKIFDLLLLAIKK